MSHIRTRIAVFVHEITNNGHGGLCRAWYRSRGWRGVCHVHGGLWVGGDGCQGLVVGAREHLLVRAGIEELRVG